MQNQDKILINNSLHLVKQCPVCHTRYSAREVQIVDYTKNGALLYFSCPVCLSSLLVNVTEMPFGLIGSATLTDLEVNEIQKFKNAEPVNADDVLEVYKMLEK